MRIGLLGGSFNPVHDGHRHISLAAMKRLGLHQVWWLVTPGNPLKSLNNLPSIANRCEAAEKLAAHPRIVVTGFEAGLKSPFAIDTIDFLRQRYRGVNFVWLMGGDNLAQIHLWHRWQAIFAALPILVIDRPTQRHKAFAAPAAHTFRRAYVPDTGIPALPKKQAPAWSYLALPLNKCSSTALRELAAAKALPEP